MRQSHSRGQLSPTPRKICDKVRVCLLTRDEVTPLGPRQGCAAAWFRGLPLRGEFWGQCGRERPAKPGEQVSSQRPRHAEGVRALQKAVEPAGPPPPGLWWGTPSLGASCGVGGVVRHQRGKSRPRSIQLGGRTAPLRPGTCLSCARAQVPLFPRHKTQPGSAALPAIRAGGCQALTRSAPPVSGERRFFCLEPKVPRRELHVPVPCLEPNGSCLSCDPHGAEMSSCPLSRCPASVPAGSPGNAHRTVAPPGPLGGVQ